MQAKTILFIAAITGAAAVLFGAFGAHGLKDFLESTSQTGVYETAVRFQFYHTFLLLALGILAYIKPAKQWSIAAWCCLTGIILFCGSLYGLVFTNARWFGPVTPLGGIFFIAAWILTGVGAYGMNKNIPKKD